MSALEPDAPAAHVFPHWREAVRAWHAHRTGSQPSRASMGAVRGKGAGIDDVLRVGRALRTLDLLTKGGELNRHGRMVLAVCLGLAPRHNAASGAEGAQHLVKRLERLLRRRGIVAPERKRWALRRGAWVDPNDGESAATSFLVEPVDIVGRSCSG